MEPARSQVHRAPQNDQPLPDAYSLLHEIAGCPIAQAILRGDFATHACSEIVQSQGAGHWSDFQVPEPWNGPLLTAPILFLSSNPSFSEIEDYPTGDESVWPVERVEDFFNGRFGAGREEWTRKGIHYRRKDGSFSSGNAYVRFWASIKARADEALGRPSVPGVDYVSTEIVHCKSRAEKGILDAAQFCSDRYLERILAASNAGVVIVLGSYAHEVFCRRYGMPRGIGLVGSLTISERNRHVIFLPHPNARLRHRRLQKKLSDALSSEQLEMVRGHLHQP